MSDRGKLGKFLKEVIDWRWDEFCIAEKDTNYKSYEAAVFSLIRTCADAKLGAIQLAIDRVDGKIETPVKFEYPRVFVLFPDASNVALPSPDSPPPTLASGEDFDTVEEENEVIDLDEEPPTLTLRQTVNKMADQPRLLTQLIDKRRKEVEEALRKGEKFDESEGKQIPLVKSVIAAHLLMLAESGKFEAITEVFDQIDGKLVETIKIIGEDLYITSYALEAPYGAEKNKDGVYMIESPQVEGLWREKRKRD